MKHKILWLMVSFLLVAALVLASCGPAAPGEQEEEEEEEEPVAPGEQEEEEPVAPGEQEEEEEEPAVGGPQYGGTFTVYQGEGGFDPENPDMGAGFWRPTQFLQAIQEKPLIGDFEKYGPRGTGEYAFQCQACVPERFRIGLLLESWDVSPDEVVWHVRPGIHWAADNVDWMENRELTAQDMVDDLIYFREAPAGGAFAGMSGDIYATDKYTLVIEYSHGFNVDLMWRVAQEDRALYSPPEMITAGADKWENQVGTGPFMFKEYVVGSHMTFKRNPNYRRGTTINGVEYQLPFVDEVVFSLIPDEATKVAALRTGVLDFCERVKPMHWSTLKETAPGLLQAKYTGGRGRVLNLKTSEPPFDNREVRRAVMVGTNFKAFADLEGGGPAPLHWFPLYVGNPEIYTPLEDLPAETRLLYDYNPELAKQMLADAGYPDGFKTYYYTGPTAYYQDQGALLKDMWAKIGVEVEIKSCEETTWRLHMMNHTYEGAIFYSWTPSTPESMYSQLLDQAHPIGCSMWWDNEPFNKLVAEMLASPDPDERNRLAKEAGLILLNEVPLLPIFPIAESHSWWPWIKNYYGETNVDDNNFVTVLAYAWLDQDLKAEMGY